MNDQWKSNKLKHVTPLGCLPLILPTFLYHPENIANNKGNKQINIFLCSLVAAKPPQKKTMQADKVLDNLTYRPPIQVWIEESIVGIALWHARHLQVEACSAVDPSVNGSLHAHQTTKGTQNLGFA